MAAHRHQTQHTTRSTIRSRNAREMLKHLQQVMLPLSTDHSIAQSIVQLRGMGGGVTLRRWRTVKVTAAHG